MPRLEWDVWLKIISTQFIVMIFVVVACSLEQPLMVSEEDLNINKNE